MVRGHSFGRKLAPYHAGPQGRTTIVGENDRQYEPLSYSPADPHTYKTVSKIYVYSTMGPFREPTSKTSIFALKDRYSNVPKEAEPCKRQPDNQNQVEQVSHTINDHRHDPHTAQATPKPPDPPAQQPRHRTSERWSQQILSMTTQTMTTR